MSLDQCLDRAELCFSMRLAASALTERKTAMDKACWLWLFVWAGMFE